MAIATKNPLILQQDGSGNLYHKQSSDLALINIAAEAGADLSLSFDSGKKLTLGANASVSSAGAISASSATMTGSVTADTFSANTSASAPQFTATTAMATPLINIMNGASVAGSISVLNGYVSITGLSTLAPSDASAAVSKGYIDSVVQGLNPKQSVVAATTADTALLGSTTPIDGVTVSVGDRVLVWMQADPKQNGIYVVAAGAWTRASDMDAPTEFAGAYVFAEKGALYGANGFVCTNRSDVTIGTDNVTFVQFTGAGDVLAGNGIAKNGNQLSVNLQSASGLALSSSGLAVAPGAGIYIDDSNLTAINLAASGTSGLSTASGLKVVGSNSISVGDNVAAILDPNGGLQTGSAGISLLANSAGGITTNAYGSFIKLNGSSALATDSSGLALTLGANSGLSQSASGLIISLPSGSGLSTAGGLSIQAGDGITVANTVNVKPNASTAISVDSSGVGLVLTTSSGLAQTSSGLAVQAGGGISVGSTVNVVAGAGIAVGSDVAINLAGTSGLSTASGLAVVPGAGIAVGSDVAINLAASPGLSTTSGLKVVAGAGIAVGSDVAINLAASPGLSTASGLKVVGSPTILVDNAISVIVNAATAIVEDSSGVGLALTSSSGLAQSSSGLAVQAGAGIKVGDNVAINLASTPGLSTSAGLAVVPNTSAAIMVDSGGVGISLPATGAVGLSTSGGLHVVAGNGISVNGNVAAVADPSGALAVTSAGIKALAANGISVSASGIAAVPYYGIKVDSNGIALNANGAYGLQANASGASINLAVNSGMQLGSGLAMQFADASLATNGSGAYVNLVPNVSGLQTNASGLSVKFDSSSMQITAGYLGAKFADASLSKNASGQFVQHDSSLIAVANIGLAVNTATNSGLAINSGLKIQLADTSLQTTNAGLLINLAGNSGLQVNAGLSVKYDSSLKVVPNVGFLAVNTAVNSGLQISNGLSIALNTNSGLATTSTGLKIALADATLATSNVGLYVQGVPALFTINGSAVSANVVAANVNTLVAGPTSDAAALHAHSYSAGQFTAAEDLSLGDAVCFDATGKVEKAAGATSGRQFCVGIAAASATSGGAVTIIRDGLATGLSGLTPGAAYYVNPAGGPPMTYPGTGTRWILVGWALSASSMMVQVQDMGYVA